jgi:hypothetical protein
VRKKILRGGNFDGKKLVGKKWANKVGAKSMVTVCEKYDYPLYPYCELPVQS